MAVKPSVLVPLADGCEEIEAVTIIDVLRRGGIDVTAAGLEGGIVHASRGVKLEPDTDLESALRKDYDMIVLPGGGGGADRLEADPRIADLLRRMAASGKFTAAICAAPKVLAAAGVLDDRVATSYPGYLDERPASGMRYSNDAVVQDGKVITSRGPGTAMDFALKLVDVLVGAEKRREVEQGLQRVK
jgi:4-methyl-5(b-hydroxyethyl)-thiazole monophosphate biosynthesis